LGLAVFGVLLAVLLGGTLIHLSGVNLQWSLRQIVSVLSGSNAVGIWQEDALLGWVNIPGSTGRHRKPLVYDVTYHVDEYGHRPTSGTYDRPKILILGDSYTFGQGVEDAEPFPSRLQEHFPDLKIVNGGVSAWSTGQALLALRQYLAEYRDIKLVVYQFITADLERNYRRRSWLDHIARSRGLRVPFFDLEGDRLVFRGLADPVRDGLPPNASLAVKERVITSRMLIEMDELCRAAAIPFVVVYLPDETQGDFRQEVVEVIGAERLYDLRAVLDYNAVRFGILDGHPSAQGHRLIADALTPWLLRFLTP
jgi:lysophospholipase L1-like esterase